MKITKKLKKLLLIYTLKCDIYLDTTHNVGNINDEFANFYYQTETSYNKKFKANIKRDNELKTKKKKNTAAVTNGK